MFVCLEHSDRILPQLQPLNSGKNTKKRFISGTLWDKSEDAVLLRLYNEKKDMAKYQNSTKRVFIADLREEFIKKSKYPRSAGAIRSRLHTLKRKRRQTERDSRERQRVKINTNNAHKDDVSSASDDEEYDNGKHQHVAYSTRSKTKVFVCDIAVNTPLIVFNFLLLLRLINR